MGFQHFKLVSDSALEKQELEYKIQNNLIDNYAYAGLSEEEQNKVKAVLFEMYSQPVATPQALSAIEFMIFGFSKMMFKIIGENPNNLTEEEKGFYELFKAIVQQHEITLNASDWYLPYVIDKMQKALQNREEYKQKKVNITGTF
jgi:hypothetical protein